MKLLVFVLLFSCLLGSPAMGTEQIVFNISPAGYPPYMIKKSGEPPGGIMWEVLQTIASKHAYTVIPKAIPRKRVSEQIDRGKLDATPRAKEWTSNPENYVFTDSIIEIRDVLFSLKKNPVQFDRIEDLFGKTLSTHLGYKYPMFAPYIENKRIRVKDATNEKAMLEMVLKKRTDASIVNELVGQWLIKQNSAWQGKFVRSQKAVERFDYRIMFGKKWKSFVEIFNQELSAMKQNGELEKIISQYK